MSSSDLQLAAEMAVISTVKSAELVEKAKDTAQLQQLQEKLDEDKDRVTVVKKVLSSLDDHGINLTLAKQMDNHLLRSDVDISADDLGDVQGVECLGRTLMPSVYRKTRLQGCESFLGDFYRKAKEITAHITAGFHESYLLFTQSVDSLQTLVDLLEKELDAAPSFKAGTGTIALGTRLFNLFKVGGKVNEDWVGGVTKLSATLNALSTNYYLSSNTALNNTVRYFGGFADDNDGQALKRFLLLPKAVPSNRFKECSYPNKEHSNGNIVAKQSVELMGGAYFLDKRNERKNLNPTNVEQVVGYVHALIDLDGVEFFNSSPVEYPRVGTEISTLSSDTIRSLIKLMRSTLVNWRKAADLIERYKVSDSDFNDVTRGIYESAMSDEMKDRVQSAFASLVRKNQVDLLTNRAAVNNYLVLEFNGIVEICNTSIAANLSD